MIAIKMPAHRMVPQTMLYVPPIVVTSGIAGFVLVTIGAMRKNRGILSLGLMLSGVSFAFAGFGLASLVGWDSGDELSESQRFGRSLLYTIGCVGVGISLSGLIGAWSRSYFWKNYLKS